MLSWTVLYRRGSSSSPFKHLLKRGFCGISASTNDAFVSCMNGQHDVVAKAVSCRNIVQELITKAEMSDTAAYALGSVVTGSLLMGAGLKGDENLQTCFVGDSGLKHVLAVTNGMLEVRGKVGNASFTLENSSIKDNTSVNVSSTAPADIAIPLSSLLGDRCEIQMVRSHPMWKHPMNSVTPADTQASLCDNLLEYLKISEQQNCHLLLNVSVVDGVCLHAVGCLVTPLPDVSETSALATDANMKRVGTLGLPSYLTNAALPTSIVTEAGGERMHISHTQSCLVNIVEDCTDSIDIWEESTTLEEGAACRDKIWFQNPVLKCTCSADTVWRALRSLPKLEQQDMMKDAAPANFEVKCDFCSHVYTISKKQMTDKLVP